MDIERGPCDGCKREFRNAELALVVHSKASPPPGLYLVDSKGIRHPVTDDMAATYDWSWLCRICASRAEKPAISMWRPSVHPAQGAIASHWRRYAYPDGIGGYAAALVAIDQFAGEFSTRRRSTLREWAHGRR